MPYAQRCFALAVFCSWPLLPIAARGADFIRDVQPIFAAHCLKCHGPEKQKNGFRLDDAAVAFRGGDSGKAAIVASDSAASALFQRITTTNSDEIMPPKGERLSAKDVATIRAWIDSGAPWPTPLSALNPNSLPTSSKHWAFQPISRPLVPRVKNSKWPRNAIDNFILARLEHERIRPSAEADRSTLIRRLYLDLLGLPPTPEEVDAFVGDKRSDAYERLVEALLASPHFGERWGRHWLDLARYADSAGYQIDRVRPGAYLYRDWVIDAFNRDLPFDQFTIEQLAGDLLPNATIQQKLATGFHRNTLSNFEDGVDAREFECKAKVDRVATTGTVWLGLTVGCAECHSHKYDPITQREFYQLYAFFDQDEEIDVPAPDPITRKEEPAMLLRRGTNAVKTFVHVRGDFLTHGEEVEPGVVGVLNSFNPRSSRREEAHFAKSEIRNPKSEIEQSLLTSAATKTHCADRLDLARWIVAPENPLTARAEVNRTWQHLFGRGIVATPEDFGMRGDKPLHPELLDWLATEFRERGWSRKELIRLIVTSATYRQSSHMRSDLTRIDPENLFLARQNRFRVESEIVRDLYLSASGLLNRRIGGPSFFPAIPEDVKAIGYGAGGEWVATEGPEKYRRGIYVVVRRTVPYPVAMTFDQANANECCPRRERSNTPLQVLTLMNNPMFAECAASLGRRIANGLSADARAKIEYGFRLCLGRAPTSKELNRLERLFRDELQLARVNEEQAWRGVAEVLLNLEEFLTRE